MLNPSGLNSTGFALDEINGPGVNETIYTLTWDSAFVFRPIVLAVPVVPVHHETVDRWVVRERRLIYIPRDRRRLKAEGRRGWEVTQ